ncbi:thiopeptide-type bacteriocin biosynthesis protein [Sorangium sp. So ce1389]|uniref:thiopeptide-type bacteriocin biosynthesis protein n=1 Tax=Sorangium sp. So ce1389 TaxID=3133336 RepID=UPI003F5E8314
MSWIYRKLFHDRGPEGEGTDALLLGLVDPLVSGLEGSGAIDRFFFLRYAEGGDHLRLRVRVAPGRDPEGVAARVDAAAARCAAVSRAEAAAYEPELEKHGGPVGMEIAERQFFASSRFALGCIRKTAGRPRARALVAACALDALLARAGVAGDARRSFLAAYARHWRTFARAISGVELACAAPDAESVALVRALVRGEGLAALGELVDGERALLAAFDADLPELAEASRRGALGAPLATVVTNLAHTFHNRLGLTLAFEVWVADALAEAGAPREPPRARPPSVSPGEAWRRLARAAEQRRPVTALLDHGEGAALDALLDPGEGAALDALLDPGEGAARRHGVRLIAPAAPAGGTSAPFALLRALADAHPAGGALLAALGRIEAAHDAPECPLPPDPASVAEALRAFLAEHTLEPTVLVLRGVDGADADTQHAVAFLARALETEPLALVLAASGRPSPGWAAIVAEIEDGPGLLRVAAASSASAPAPAPALDGEAAAPAVAPGPAAVARGEAFCRAGALHEAAAILGDALASPGLSPAARADALVALARTMLRMSRPALARKAAEAALRLRLPERRRALARRVLLAALHNLGETAALDALRDEVARAVAPGASGASAAERCWAELDAALACATSERRAEHEARLDALLAAPRGDAPPQCLAAAHAWRGAAHAARGELERGLAHQRRALAFAEELADFRRALMVRVRLASSVAAAGELAEAAALFETAACHAAWIGLFDLAALAAQSAISLGLARRDPAPVRAWLDGARPARARVWRSPYGELAVLYARAESALARGEAGAAGAHLDRLRARLAAAVVDARAAPQSAPLLALAAAHLEADVAAAAGDDAGWSTRPAAAVVDARAAELTAGVPPEERRLVAALARARRDAARGAGRVDRPAALGLQST